MTDLYKTYTDYVEKVCNSGNLDSFKRHPDYTYMLEHVSVEYGKQYLYEILTKTRIGSEDILEFCTKNDAVGSPVKAQIGDFFVSPSSLRYIYQAFLILTHLKSLGMKKHDLVEVGGGYGGLCLAIHWLAPKFGIKIDSYTIIDLPSPSRLQKMYLGRVEPSLSISFVGAMTYGLELEVQDAFLISNYCFSEIDADSQKKYVECLFPKIAHGFIAWNHIPVYDFGFQMKVEEEVPKTGSLNKYVYF